MRIIIDLDEDNEVYIYPVTVYRKLRKEYYGLLSRKYGRNFWGLETSCDNMARELYSHIKNRRSNVKDLIFTYKDAEECAEIFQKCANMWVAEMVNRQI